MKTRSTLFLLTFFISIFLAASCQKSLDDQYIPYIGTWSSDKFALEIYKNGRGVYQKQNQDPIECDVKIENNKIKFRNGMHRNFTITAEPFENQDGYTVMFLDNDIFYKH